MCAAGKGEPALYVQRIERVLAEETSVMSQTKPLPKRERAESVNSSRR